MAYFHTTVLQGRIDITMIYAVFFFASIAVFAYLAYKLHQKRKWRERWVLGLGMGLNY